LVGICSYLLINFWFRRLQANKAAIQAIIINRIGDWGFSLGLFSMFLIFGNLDFTTTMTLAPSIDSNLLNILTLFLLIGAMAKSAQIGLHIWLPNAMEGPTPVSALIHAATMVTAGVYLLLRCSPLLENAPTTSVVVTLIGATTAFMAATIGLVQNDLKRVIAYSTCSQLGYMVFACGLSNYNVALFHLVNHAFFKALLFLSAGAVIHALPSGEQDFRKMGGLRYLLPFTYTMMLIGSLSLMALPFLTGFYSKDLILEQSFTRCTITGAIAYWLGTISALFTSFYSLRLLTLAFFGYPNGSKSTYESVHEVSLLTGAALLLLALLSIFFGAIARDAFVGMGTSFLANSLFVHPNHLSYVEAEFGLPLIYKQLPLIVSLIGGTLAFILFQNFPSFSTSAIIRSPFMLRLHRFLSRKYYFDTVYSLILQSGLSFGYLTNKIIDRGTLEVLGPYGLVQLFSGRAAPRLSRLDSGFIPSYLLYIFIGFITLLSFALFDIDPKLILLMLWTVFFLA
jgi:NADH-ubiquinone oxidoreductase chain 5